MKNTNRDTANAAPQHDRLDDEYKTKYATASNDDPDEDEEEDEDDDEVGDTEDDEEEAARDWGHVDPTEGNSPFLDSNEPTAPGSAV